MNTIYCDFYEICGTATYVKDEDLEFFSLVGWEQYNDRYAKTL